MRVFISLIMMACTVLLFGQCKNFRMKVQHGGDVGYEKDFSEIDSITFVENDDPEVLPSGVVVSRIYGDGSTYCAFTSMIKKGGTYYLAFREGNTHVSEGDYGVIRILTSTDGNTWDLKQTLQKESTDLRDPNLSVMPNGRILLVCGGRTKIGDNSYGTIAYYSIESETGFSPVVKCNIPTELIDDTSNIYWIWKITWNGDTGYGVCYMYDGSRLTTALVNTNNGKDYSLVSRFDIPANSDETRIRFLPDGTAIALVRRDIRYAYMGKSSFPYTDWQWKELDVYLAGQEFIIEGEKIVCVTRQCFNLSDRTCILYGDLDGHFNWSYTLPSSGIKNAGDTSYAGIIDEGSSYRISYYSKHASSKPCIYMAIVPKIVFPKTVSD